MRLFAVAAHAVCFVNLKGFVEVDFHMLTLIVKLCACFRHFDFLPCEDLGGALIGIFQTGTTEYTKENAIATATSEDDGSFSISRR